MPNKKQSTSGYRSTFPHRLHCLLSNAAQLGVDDIISWDSSGEKFIIYHKERFVEKILPNIFKQSHYSSFRRQINAYGFEKESVHPLVYFRRNFRRDYPTECNEIKRRRSENTVRGLKNNTSQPYPLNLHDEAQSFQWVTPYINSMTSSTEINRCAMNAISILNPTALQGQPDRHNEEPGNSTGNILKYAITPDSAQSINDDLLDSRSSSCLPNERKEPREGLGKWNGADGLGVRRSSWKRNMLLSTSLESSEADLPSSNFDIAPYGPSTDDAKTFDQLLAFLDEGLV